MTALAYVFWHQARPGVEPPEYEGALRDFHRRLAGAGVEGFLGSWSVRLPAIPWLADGPGYEDRYLIADFTSLGVLNAAAVAGPQRRQHDAAAARAAGGIAGLYGCVHGDPSAAAEAAVWFGKPDGRGYADFLAECAPRPGETLWQRQLTLGPTPEFQLTGTPPLTAPAPGTRLELTRV